MLNPFRAPTHLPEHPAPPLVAAPEVVLIADIPDGAGRDEALDFLSARGIPLVVNTSRTRAEIDSLRRLLPGPTPFISENGGALVVPQGCLSSVPREARPGMGGSVIEFGAPYYEVVEHIRRVCRQLRMDVVGFADLTIEEASRELGIPLAEARLAKLREYSELFRLRDDTEFARGRLVAALGRHGLRCCRVGRHHLATAAPDRATSVRTLRSIWRRAGGEPLFIGLGQSQDDVSWLRQVDVAVIVRGCRSEDPRAMLARLPHAHVTREAGAAGWAEAILYLVGGLRR